MTDDRGTREPLGVDGGRPCVEWVSALPGEWTTTPQRLILFVLACDAFEATSRPGIDNLSGWCGLSRNRTFEVLAQLCRPEIASDGTLIRPPLVQRVDKQGQPLPEGRNYGRERVGFRLLSTANGTDARSGRYLDPLEAQRYGQPSGQRYGEPSRIPPQTGTTPFPSLPSSSASELATDRAPGDDDAIVEAARRVAAVAADAGKRWDAAGIAKYLRALVAHTTLADAEAQAAAAASDPGADTPAAIKWDRFKAAPPAATDPSGPTCRACGKTRTGHDRNRDNTGDPHGWEPVGAASPHPQEEQVGQFEKESADEPVPEEQPGGNDPAEPPRPDARSDQRPGKPTADPPAEPHTDTPPSTADRAESRQRPRYRPLAEILAERLDEKAPGAQPTKTPTEHEAA